MMHKKLKSLHEELWSWLAETGALEKSDWPDWNRDDVRSILNGISYASNYINANDCFACGAAALGVISDRDGHFTCDYCPIYWGPNVYGNTPCRCDAAGTAYADWCDAIDDEDLRRRAARWIAEAWENPTEWDKNDER